MADFNITVDTMPMANSINSVSGHVKSVTGAVIAMQSAVVSAEQEASRKICANVDNGFYILMRSQLSQKIAACSSTMSSKLMLMQKFMADIQRLQSVMQEDYNRICRRYMKQFNALDKSLEVRIRELDRAAMELGELQKSLSSRLKNDSSAVMLYADETQIPGQQAVEARVKVRSVKAIEAMTKDIIGTRLYTDSVNHILKEKPLSQKTEEFVPAIVTHSDSMFDRNTSVSNVFVPQNASFPAANVSAKVQSDSEAFEWKDMDANELEKVKSSFVQMCSSADLDDRVAKEMLRLFESSTLQSAVNKTGAE